jgi:hypothetical protein
LAHELNNPASAAQRAAAHLQETMDKVQTFLCPLSKALESEHWQVLLDASQEALMRKAPELDHLARSDRSESVANWLDAHHVPDAWDIAPTLVNSGLDSDWLAALTDKLPQASHVHALGWLAARLSLKSLVDQIDQSTMRIAQLVKAVKSYSCMDQSPMQEVDIHEGLRAP